MLKTIRPLKLPTCIFCELTRQTLSYLRIREVFKTQIKSRDTSKNYVCFVYDVSSVFFWWGNIVSEMQEISPQLGWSLCFLFAFEHLTIFPKDEAWKMRLHASFCIYIFSEQFFRCQEHKCKQKKRVSALPASQNYILYAGAFVFLQVQHCFNGSTLDSPCPQQVIHISTSVFSVKSFCILCRAQEGCGLLFTFKWGKLAFAWFLQYNAYFTFKREKKGGNKPQYVRWVTCSILVQASLSLLLWTAFHRTWFQDDSLISSIV